MRRARLMRVGFAGALASTGLIAIAPLAVADPTALIGNIRLTASGMSIPLSATDGKNRSNIHLNREISITLRPEDGSPPVKVPGTAELAGTSEQNVMLAIDNSSSMGDDGIREARAAATQFLDDVPPTVRVGLVIFADRAVVAERLTTDRARVEATLAGEYGQGPGRNTTALYSAVDKSLKALGRSGFRDVLLLSDGADDSTIEPGGTREEGDGRRWQPTISRIERSGIPVTAIAFRPDADRKTLQEMADAAGGRFVKAGTGDLGPEFERLAAQVDSRVVVDVTVPPALRTKDGIVEISGFADDKPITARSGTTYFAKSPGSAPAPSAAAPQADSGLTAVDRPGGIVISSPMMGIALVAIFLALAVIVGSALGLVRPRETQEAKVLRRLSVYTLSGRQPQQVATETSTTSLGDSVLARSAVNLVGRMVTSGRFDVSIDQRLDAAGIPMRTAEWTLLHIGSAVGSALVLLALSGGAPLPAILGLVLGIAGPWVYLSLRRGRRERAFLAQLPDTLQLLAGSLQAGYSLPQAMDSIVREGKPPIASEFNRALIETRLGMPAEDALDAIAERMGSRDFSWIVMAIRIQRDVGGNLAELLSSVAGTLRERERLRRQVVTLSAEGRLSGWILGLLPVVFLLYLSVVRPEYLSKLYTPYGYVLLTIAGILLAVGGFWMSRVVKVEV